MGEYMAYDDDTMNYMLESNRIESGYIGLLIKKGRVSLDKIKSLVEEKTIPLEELIEYSLRSWLKIQWEERQLHQAH